MSKAEKMSAQLYQQVRLLDDAVQERPYSHATILEMAREARNLSQVLLETLEKEKAQ